MAAITLDQWNAHPSFRKELAGDLALPAVVVALEMVKAQGTKSLTVPGSGVDIIHYFAIMGAKRDGCLETLINLQNLTNSEPAEVPERQAWTTPRKPDGTPLDESPAIT